jgi:hypothetical protein
MKRIALAHAASSASAPVLARPERATDRLLVWAWRHGTESGGAAFIDAYVSEGWNVLEAGSARADVDAAAFGLVEAIKQARSHIGSAATVFVADDGMAPAVCRAVVLAHRSDLLKSRCGLVTIDAFAGNGISALCDELAELRNLATIWAVHRTDRVLRERTLRHHTTLQKLGRETHFMALPDPARSLAEQLTDSRDPLGRETRWLLDPVHSRTA